MVHMLFYLSMIYVILWLINALLIYTISSCFDPQYFWLHFILVRYSRYYITPWHEISVLHKLLSATQTGCVWVGSEIFQTILQVLMDIHNRVHKCDVTKYLVLEYFDLDFKFWENMLKLSLLTKFRQDLKNNDGDISKWILIYFLSCHYIISQVLKVINPVKYTVVCREDLLPSNDHISSNFQTI